MEKQFTSKILKYSDLGLIDYQKAWDLQHSLFEKRRANTIDDTLLLLEHPHTYTFGKSADKSNLLFDDEELKKREISLFDIDRGGDITYHGPGQIVGYAIIDLKIWEQDTHKYLRALEEVIIQTLAEYGIVSGRIENHTGVWVEDKKICALGIKVSRWISMHGFALNINTDMNLFNGIIPCGIENKGVVSLKEIIGENIPIEKVKTIIVEKFKLVFNYGLIVS
ncbi:MAG: lipoyl(octanoyl) transferase LipB [Melioribacteraceae bacterium]|jgi:lipoyl(octanoyl) transferase|nr:lipoyl(octanoyl) transferase LipB [Melioribacteraceae bacterium]